MTQTKLSEFLADKLLSVCVSVGKVPTAQSEVLSLNPSAHIKARAGEGVESGEFQGPSGNPGSVRNAV